MKSAFRESAADFLVSGSPDASPDGLGGVVDTGGVDPVAGVLELAAASPSPPATASDECWRLSYSFC